MASLQAHWMQTDCIKPKFKLGFGPAWTSELGDLRYTLTANGEQGTTQNKFGYNASPWLDGGVQAKIYDYFVADFYGGGGWMRKGYGMIVQKILVSSTSGGSPLSGAHFEYDTDVTCNFLTTFAGAGVCYDHLNRFFIALTAGYAFSKQSWNSVQHVVPYTHDIINKWKSPYLGIEAAWDICDCFRFDVNYRALIGHASSYDKLYLNGANLSNTCRFVPKFFGNLVALNCIYEFADCWNTGLSFLYNSFQSFRRGCILPATTVSQINRYFNRLRFNMFAFTLSIGYNY